MTSYGNDAGDTAQITHDELEEGMVFSCGLLNQAREESVAYTSDVLTLTIAVDNVVVMAVFEGQM